jgi:hypothetical protein
MLRISVFATILVGATIPTLAQAPQNVIALDKVVLAGERTRLNYWYALENDCTSLGKTIVRILRGPKNGKVEVDVGPGFPDYQKDNTRFKCNEKSVDVTRLWYTSNGDFKGRDVIELEVIYPTGGYRKSKIAVTVK